MAESSCFAFGPNKSYVYLTPSKWKWSGIDQELHQFLLDKKPKNLLWAAIGPQSRNYAISYMKSNMESTVVYEPGGTPQQLIDWFQKDIDEQLRVSLGPDGSFIAWTSTSIRWHNIPDGLTEALQSWLSPSGWKSGPPRIVSLGYGGSYFALSEYGAYSWEIPDELCESSEAMKELADTLKVSAGTMSEYEVMSISASEIGVWVWIKRDLSYRGHLWDWDAFETVFDSLFAEEQAKKRKLERERKAAEKARQNVEEERQAREQAAQEKRRKDAEEKERLRKAKEEAAERVRRRKADEEAEEWAVQYYLWETAVDDDILKGKTLTTFPHFPDRLLFCKEVSCVVFKNEEDSLRACQHDVEKFFRASGKYELAWLRRERLKFHPDRFGRRCDPDFRKSLKRKAEQLYQIFGILIALETPSGQDE